VREQAWITIRAWIQALYSLNTYFTARYGPSRASGHFWLAREPQIREGHMAVKVLAWRYDHIGDCNRYGNCVDHPYYERPTLDELARFPDRLPDAASALQSVPSDVVTLNGEPEGEASSGYETLRTRADYLRAALGEAIHRIQRGHPEDVEEILESAGSAYDRGFE